MMALPPPVGLDQTFTDFPDTFRDLFSKMSDENDEGIAALLEDKLIPRGNRRQQDRRWVLSRRSFHRRPVDYMNKAEGPDVATSPSTARRRSSSIAVARQPPDLHRFLQTEQQRPWGHLSPGPACSPSPSPGNSRPVSPRPRHNITSTNNNNTFNYRSRTASMPVVPRHKVRATISNILCQSKPVYVFRPCLTISD